MSFGVVQAEKMTTESGYSLGAGNASSFKNRIINGAMVLSQYANGTSITPASTGTSITNFAVDRTRIAYSQNSKLTAQQNAGSVTPPVGFKNYLGVSVAATATVGATDYFLVGQAIEGYNMADLAWGTVNAKTVTLSFWAYSNTTGTFGGAINNSAYDRSFPFSYTINSANTWEYKTVTITGDQSGTWLTTNGVGAYVWFSVGSGSSVSTTANSWAAGTYYSSTGATSLMGSTSNLLYVTGIQLEVGTVATSFDFRSYGTELALCQRYFHKLYVNSGNGYQGFTVAAAFASNNARGFIQLPVTMRTIPSLSYSGTFEILPVNTTITSIDLADSGGNPTCMLSFIGSSMTVGNAYEIRSKNDLTTQLSFSAEL